MLSMHNALSQRPRGCRHARLPCTDGREWEEARKCHLWWEMRHGNLRLLVSRSETACDCSVSLLQFHALYSLAKRGLFCTHANPSKPCNADHLCLPGHPACQKAECPKTGIGKHVHSAVLLNNASSSVLTQRVLLSSKSVL